MYIACVYWQSSPAIAARNVRGTLHNASHEVDMGILLERHVNQMASARASGDWKRLSTLQYKHPATAPALAPRLASCAMPRGRPDARVIVPLRALGDQGHHTRRGTRRV